MKDIKNPPASGDTQLSSILLLKCLQNLIHLAMPSNQPLETRGAPFLPPLTPVLQTLQTSSFRAGIISLLPLQKANFFLGKKETGAHSCSFCFEKGEKSKSLQILLRSAELPPAQNGAKTGMWGGRLAGLPGRQNCTHSEEGDPSGVLTGQEAT